MTDKTVVLVTCTSARQARRIARAIVEDRRAACVNILPIPVHSIYRWKGRVESAKEFLLVIKTSREHFRALQTQIRRLHSYDIPEIIALPIAAGSREYLAWIAESLRQPATRRKSRR